MHTLRLWECLAYPRLASCLCWLLGKIYMCWYFTTHTHFNNICSTLNAETFHSLQSTYRRTPSSSRDTEKDASRSPIENSLASSALMCFDTCCCLNHIYSPFSSNNSSCSCQLFDISWLGNSHPHHVMHEYQHHKLFEDMDDIFSPENNSTINFEDDESL
jgi:hypothetical protein